VSGHEGPIHEIERLNLRTKFLYGAGSISYGARLWVMGLLLFYYNQVVGLPAELVSLALSISLMVDAFWDPAIGHFSDNLRTRWGRRHPLMYAAIVPAAIAFAMLWRPPEGLSDWETFGWLLSFVLLTRFGLSLYEVPSAALAPELAPDYHDRTATLSYRYVMQILGGTAATCLGYFWFFRPTPEYASGQLNPAAWGPLTLWVAAIMVVSMLVCALGTHHRIPKLHKPAARRLDLRALGRDLVITVKNWNFGVAVAAATVAGMAAGVYSGLQLYLDTFFWGLPARDVGVLMVSNLVATFFAAFIANALSRRVGKKPACIWLFFISLAILEAPILARLFDILPQNGDPLLMPLLTVQRFLYGLTAAGGFICVTSMIADITEDVQAKTGRRAEGLLMTADSLLNQLMTSLSALLPGLMLAAVAFPVTADPATIDRQVVNNLAWLYVPITATVSSLSIAVWFFYRIDKTTHDRNLASIRQAQALAEARLEARNEPETIGVPGGLSP
jgi:glycoside/pentoside/hexuronide:cation symporter, GPH family